ncbi:hypothetical protein ACFO3O_21700 [Dokdonia ponticola]|uniref:DUF5689 domain-containing protein n=1 Tax=Dokdonia ponticola TaxID=2041041 RepID=A0ABV9I2X6_9FLAO
MKKIISYCLLVTLFTACSTEKNTDSSSQIASFEIENYKGIFTTANGEDRGTLDVTLSEDGRSATADLTLASGEIVSVFTDQVAEIGNKKEISFISNEFSFTMTTGEEEEILEINTVIYRGVESSILASKNTERAPVNPITGTYVCEMCPAPLDNTSTQTFNLMFTTANGNSAISSQTTLSTTVFNGKAQQNSCTPNGSLTTCSIVSGDGMTTIGFIAGEGPVTWSGSHTFNNEPTGVNDCSGTSGTWSWDSPILGVVGGTFISDATCTTPLITLYSEDFQTFTGAGFAPIPATGQLDSDIVIANGFNSGTLTYGGTQASGDYARGTSTGGVNTGGIYAFDVDGAGNTTLGVQPTGVDFTPGTFDFRIENTTGITLNNFVINYDVYANNDQNRIDGLNFSYSTDNITYTPVPSLDFATPNASDALGFVAVNRSGSFSATVANAAFIYIRFEGIEIGGTGNHDEYSIDNILLQGN